MRLVRPAKKKTVRCSLKGLQCVITENPLPVPLRFSIKLNEAKHVQNPRRVLLKGLRMCFLFAASVQILVRGCLKGVILRRLHRNPSKGLLKGEIFRQLHRNPRKGLLKGAIFHRLRRNPRKGLLKGTICSPPPSKFSQVVS